jgi:hypothetical protein
VLLVRLARYGWELDGIPYTWVLVASSNEEGLLMVEGIKGGRHWVTE